MWQACVIKGIPVNLPGWWSSVTLRIKSSVKWSFFTCPDCSVAGLSSRNQHPARIHYVAFTIVKAWKGLRGRCRLWTHFKLSGRCLGWDRTNQGGEKWRNGGENQEYVGVWSWGIARVRWQIGVVEKLMCSMTDMIVAVCSQEVWTYLRGGRSEGWERLSEQKRARMLAVTLSVQLALKQHGDNAHRRGLSSF